MKKVRLTCGMWVIFNVGSRLTIACHGDRLLELAPTWTGHQGYVAVEVIRVSCIGERSSLDYSIVEMDLAQMAESFTAATACGSMVAKRKGRRHLGPQPCHESFAVRAKRCVKSGRRHLIEATDMLSLRKSTEHDEVPT